MEVCKQFYLFTLDKLSTYLYTVMQEKVKGIAGPTKEGGPVKKMCNRTPSSAANK
jgi:hypothetical protein